MVENRRILHGLVPLAGKIGKPLFTANNSHLADIEKFNNSVIDVIRFN